MTVTANDQAVGGSTGGGGGSVEAPDYQQVPTGTINGTNVTFTLAHEPQDGVVVLTANGKGMQVPNDYSLSGQTITFVEAPQVGDDLWAVYEYV